MFWRRQEPQSSSQTYLSAESEFQGNINTGGDLRVDGIVHGNVSVEGNMEVSENGLVEGTELRAKNLIVHGVVKARIIVQERLTLSKTARLQGDVNANALNIEPGAYYVGYITTTDNKALPGSPELQNFAPEPQEYITDPQPYEITDPQPYSFEEPRANGYAN